MNLKQIIKKHLPKKKIDIYESGSIKEFARMVGKNETLQEVEDNIPAMVEEVVKEIVGIVGTTNNSKDKNVAMIKVLKSSGLSGFVDETERINKLELINKLTK